VSTDAADALRELPLVRHLEDAQRREVVAAGTTRAFGRAEVLFQEGDPAEAMYAVLDGSVKLVRYTPRGKEALLHLVRRGESFAEAALFGQGTFPATAVGVDAGSVWVLPRRRLIELIRRSPEVALAMVASVSMWTRKLAAQLELLTQRRVEERLAVYLLGRAAGTVPSAGEEIRLHEARHLIAAQCGTAPEVLSRTFRRLEDDGVLQATDDGIRVLRPDRLRALAEWIDE
jgi:CRP/FNR family transcriptional regulator